MSLKQELIKLRWKVRTGTHDRRMGICGSLDPFIRNSERVQLADLFRKWPEGTGSGTFPVPHHGYKGNKTAGDAYMDALNKRDLWNPLYKYGRARRRLLTWLINQL